MANQFVVQLKNEPARWRPWPRRSRRAGWICGRSVAAGIGDAGHVIMTTADDDTTKAVLEEGGYTFVEGESLVTEVDDQPGGMARCRAPLADAGVNI